MTVSDQQTETWRPVPGARYYEASDRGRIRSLDRQIGRRFFKGVVLQLRQDKDGYLVVNITYDNGTRKYGVSVARLVLLAHAGPCPDGMEACHGPGGQRDNTWPENLRWDTKDANVADWRRDNPPAPRPQKQCIRCGEPFTGNARRCHPCVVAIGVLAAKMLSAGITLERTTAELGYPPTISGLDGIHTLARRHGGYGQPWSRRVRARWAAWLAGGDAR